MNIPAPAVAPPSAPDPSRHPGAPGDGAGIAPRYVPVPASLRPYVDVLMAVEVGAVAPQPLAIAPHDSVTLAVQLASDGTEAGREHGRNTRLTGIRLHTGPSVAVGDCITLLALLTPLGAVRVLDSQPLAAVPRICAAVADLLDRGLTRRLESDIALAPTLDAKLRVFAAWIEARATAQRKLATAALRAARAAMRLCAEPMTAVDRLADDAHVSRRQLERDFGHWIGTSPRQLAQVSRLQAVSRKAQTGASLADVAVDTGFADQAHMSRVVRQLTGLTPQRFVRARSTPLAAAFRAASGGGTVYL